MLEMAQKGPLRIRATLALMRVVEVKDGAPDLSALAAQILPAGTEPKLHRLIEHMMEDRAPIPGDAAQLGQWLCEHGMAPEASLWLEALAGDAPKDPAVLRVRAECAARTQSWADLQALLQAGAWGEIPAKVLEPAFATWRWQEQGKSLDAVKSWELALDAAQVSKPQLAILLRLAKAFDWPEKQERTLNRVVTVYPREFEAWKELVGLATRRGDTDKVLEYYHKWARAMPEYRDARLQLVLLAVLLDRIDSDVRHQLDSLDLAGEPAIKTARAWLQWRMGNTATALALVGGLDLAEIKGTRTALMVGVMLADAKQGQAGQLLRLVPEAELLPEERAFWQAAKDALGGSFSNR